MNYNKTFAVGRKVWLRDGSRWLPARVFAHRRNTIDVVVPAPGGAFYSVAVHIAVATKCLRVSPPKEGRR